MKQLLQWGCPGGAQLEAAASPSPAPGPQSPRTTENTLAYSQCSGTDGKQLPGEGTCLLLARLAGVQGTTFSSISARCRGHCPLPAGEDNAERGAGLAAEELLLPVQGCS